MASRTAIPGTLMVQGHPLMRLLFLAPTNYDGPALHTSVHSLTHTVAAVFGWKKVVGVLNYGALEDDRGINNFRMWLERTPLVFSWIRSDRFLRAPAELPAEVARVFLPYKISPYELSFTLLPISQDFNKCVLYGYCAGMTVEEIAACTGQSVDFVLSQMTWAARSLLEDPRFVVWLWNVDWTGLPIPPDVDDSLLTRMTIKNTLMSSELLQADGEQLKQIKKIAASERLQRLAAHAPRNAVRPIPSKLYALGVIRGS